ncbi:MAG: peptidase C26 [Firmicutes bacterium HGW-Firmicutes-14]|jgi:putative glutamine amidotransferase|nr:MAG: peptidase C26 [Firmicutes bacterium HGW-Firmicutes-14]
MKPLIGVTCSYDLKDSRFFIPEAYINAIIRAGGIPLVLPGSGKTRGVRPYFNAVRGLILSGGGDIDPSFFNKEPVPALGEITPERDRFEIMMIKTALKKNIPVLGICRGCQVLNVACGGSLIQHIPSVIRKPLKHSQSAPRWYPTHRITIDKSSLFHRIAGENTIMVNSFHHQSICEPAPGFRVSARSSDGVIEAVEHPGYRFVLGIQWHPECMVEKDSVSRRIFSAFIEAVKK